MKLSRLALVSAAATLLLSLSVSAKQEMKKAYIFGFASSFNDSTVYFTDIQEIDSAWFTTKNKFLVNRESYSAQLRDYLSAQGESNRTCIVTYATDQKKATKKWNKLRNRYTLQRKKKKDDKHENDKPAFLIKDITQNNFRFSPVEDFDSYNDEPTQKAKNKKAKKAAKKAAKKNKQ